MKFWSLNFTHILLFLTIQTSGHLKKTLPWGRGDMVAWNPNRIQALGFGEIWYKCGSTSPSYFVLST
jgi:hypothetical protein